jgi:hypothetical protein
LPAFFERDFGQVFGTAGAGTVEGMGTTLDAIVERFYEEKQHTPDWRSPAHWDDVARWEFNKDYPLMRALREHAKCHEGWPAHGSLETQRLEQEDVFRAYWFVATELPTSFQLDGEPFNPNERYRAMVAGLSEFKGPVRVIFLEC